MAFIEGEYAVEQNYGRQQCLDLRLLLISVRYAGPPSVTVAIGNFADPHFPAPTIAVWEESRHPANQRAWRLLILAHRHSQLVDHKAIEGVLGCLPEVPTFSFQMTLTNERVDFGLVQEDPHASKAVSVPFAVKTDALDRLLNLLQAALSARHTG